MTFSFSRAWSHFGNSYEHILEHYSRRVSPVDIQTIRPSSNGPKQLPTLQHAATHSGPFFTAPSLTVDSSLAPLAP